MKPKIKERIEKIKNGEIPEGYWKSEIGKLPKDWRTIELKNVGDIVTGNTPNTKIPEYYGEEYMFVSPGDINSNKYVYITSNYLSKKGFEISRQLPPETVMVTCIGSTIGKIAKTSKVCTTNQQINSVVCNKVYNSDYIYYSLDYYFNRIKDKIIESQAVPILNKTKFSELCIPNLSLKEQQNIAAILSTWDKAIELKQNLIEQKKLQKKGLMQNLLTGKVRLDGFDGEWEEVELGKVLNFNVKNAVTEPQKYKLLTVKLHLKGIEATDNTPNATENGRPYYICNPGEMLIGRQNFHNGGIGIVLEDMNNYIASNAISSLSAKCGILKFYYYYLSNQDFYKKVGHMIGGTGQKEVSETMLKKLKLRIPSIEEQKEIANILTTADAELDLLQKELDALKEQKKSLMQLLLTGIVRTIH